MIGTAYCEHCKKQVIAKKKECNHVLHAILSLITGGIWLIVWLLCAITCDDYYCTECGKHVKVGSEEPPCHCPKCKAIIEKDSLFCPHCGFQVEKRCKHCNEKNNLVAHFCKKCGKKLEES